MTGTGNKEWVAQMLKVLPPFMNHKVVIKDKQAVDDIVNEVLDAHQEFAGDYDNITSCFFNRSMLTIPQQLFEFVKTNIPYRVESDKFQTTVSPAGILAIKQGDCKHYASFIGGVLDAINRTGRYYFDWTYRFAGYEGDNIEHVFVVVKQDGNETWIDPAPIQGIGGTLIKRSFNDRAVMPTYVYDAKPEGMSLVRLSGIGFQSYTESHRPTGTGGSGDCCGQVGDVVSDTILTLNRDLADDGYLNKSYPPGIHRSWSGPVGVIYTVDGVEIKMPATGAMAPLPANLVVQYPDYWHGAKIPEDLPRPMVVGIRLVLLPKLGTWDVVKDNDFFWLNFLTQVIRPLVRAYSQFPDWNDGLSESYEHTGTLANTILYDLDRADIVDYISRRPITLPLTAEIPAGVRYLVNGIDLVWPVNRGNRTVGENEAEQPPNFPDNLTVVYPAKFGSYDVPTNLPKIYAQGHLLKFSDKGITVEDFSAHGFVWFSFLVRVIAPLINGYARMPYVGSGGQLSDRVWGDITGQYPVPNYLDEPNKQSWFGNLVEQTGEVIHEITINSLKIINAPARLCFMGLVRINAFAFAYKLFMTYQDPDLRNELETRWHDIGGSVGDLKEAIILGCKNNPVFGGGVKQWIEDAVKDDIIENGYIRPADDDGIPDGTDIPNPNAGTVPGNLEAPETGELDPTETYIPPPQFVRGELDIEGIRGVAHSRIGVIGADDVIYYLALAASIVAALAKFLKGIGGPKTDKVVDDVVNGFDVVLAAAGQDPIGTGGITQVPVKITDPVTGKEYTIQPPPNFKTPVGPLEWIEQHPTETLLFAGAAAWFAYEYSKDKKQNHRA